MKPKIKVIPTPSSLSNSRYSVRLVFIIMRQRRCIIPKPYPLPTLEPTPRPARGPVSHPAPTATHALVTRGPWTPCCRLVLCRASCRLEARAFTVFLGDAVTCRIRALCTQIFRQTCRFRRLPPPFPEVLAVSGSRAPPALSRGKPTPKLFPQPAAVSCFSFWSVNYHLSIYF